MKVTWETCTLRTWLNETFLRAAFSTEEQKRLQTVTVSADKNPEYSTNPGKATQDRVYLLSIPEANELFSSMEARCCTPTDYAKAQGVYAYCTAEGKPTGCWWLRSPGKGISSAAIVAYGGFVDNYGYFTGSDGVGVRPALWMKL